MKQLLSFFLIAFVSLSVHAADSARKIIRIATQETDLILSTAPNGRLYQIYLGEKLAHESDFENLSAYTRGGSDGSAATRGWEAYMTSGMEDYFEPALAVKHADGNMSTYLMPRKISSNPGQRFPIMRKSQSY